jgi:outer membrane immunogenic protein
VFWFRCPIHWFIVVSAGRVVNKSMLRIAAFCALGIATSATAEEMATPPSSFVTARVPYLAWYGLYFGINGGYAWSNPSVSYVGNDPASLAGLCVSPGGAKCIPTSDFRRDGGLFGGQVGYNWQFNSLWLGSVEADYQWSDLTGIGYSRYAVSGVNGLSTIAATETVHSFGTFRARLGALPFQSLLLYGTAGLALGQVSENLSLIAASSGNKPLSGYSYSCTAGNACFAGSASQTGVGWTAGAGAELALTTNLTLKGEALYVHLAAPSATATALNTTNGTAPSSFTGNFSYVDFIIARGGLNYRF